MSDPHLEGMKAKLKELSDADPIGFRKAAAWDAIMAEPDLAEVRRRLSADHIQRLLRVIVPAAMGAHDWFTYGRLNWECCRVCGIVRRMDGKTNKPCKGPVAVGPRSEPAIKVKCQKCGTNIAWDETCASVGCPITDADFVNQQDASVTK